MAQLSERETLIIKCLMDNKLTIYELAEKLDCHHNTVLGSLYKLIDQGYVKEYPFRKKKAKQYYTTLVANQDGSYDNLPRLPIVFSDGSKAEVSWAVLAILTTTKPNLNTTVFAASILMNLYRELRVVNDGPNEEYVTTVFCSSDEAREVCLKQLEDYKTRVDVMQQLLDREELWDSRITSELENWDKGAIRLDWEQLTEWAHKADSTILDENPVAKKRFDKMMGD